MVRKTSLALVLALGMTPLGAMALGLGDIQLKSGLNQYLNADIELLSVGEEDIADIKAKLASPAAFERAGVDRPFLLSKLRFKTQRLADGAVAVHVTSREPIREPFLNFLVEVNWPKGKLVREYTVLLDPPVTLDRRPAPVQLPRSGTEPVLPAFIQPAPPRAAVPALSPADAGGGVSEYGPTKRHDTLWGIAKKVRQEGTTMEQMMMALFMANPDAFIQDNINRLKVGQILRVPERLKVLSLSARKARELYREHMSRWKADPSAVPARSVSRPVTPKPVSTLAAEPAPEAELKIATARPKGRGEAGPSESSEPAQVINDLKQELLLAEEAKQSALQEGEELRSRVESLESQLQDMQRLLELKNEQLAQLQAARLRHEEEMQAEAARTARPEPAATAMPTVQAQPAPAKPAAQAQAAPGKPVAEPPSTVTPVGNPKRVEKGFLDTLLSDTKMLGMAGGVVIVLLALVWLLISRRRAAAEVAEFQESILVSTIDGDTEQVLDQQAEDGEAALGETSFLSDFSPSDIDTLQDETGEVDPLAEADVYIAYGRYQQADELITQAIEQDPGRIELKYKLFEILHATTSSDKYVALAEQCAAEGIDARNPEAWKKVVAMGAELAPNHPLFSGAEPVQDQADEERDLNLDELTDELGLGLESLGESEGEDGLSPGSPKLEDVSRLDEDAEEQVDDLELDLDFDLGLDDQAFEDVSSTLEPDVPDAASLEKDEFDFGLSLDLDGEIASSGSADPDTVTTVSGVDPNRNEAGTGADAQVGLDDLDELSDLGGLNLSFDDDTERALDTDSEIADLEFDIEDLAISDGGQDDNILSIEDTLESAELDDLMLPEAPEVEAQPDEGVISFDAVDDKTDALFSDALAESDVEEVSTKLDLAKAYVDLGDDEGAREILDEVLNEGNDAQKQEARQLLRDLS